MAKKDDMYILGDISKRRRRKCRKGRTNNNFTKDYQWAMMGYSIHNQFWKKGYATESVLAATKTFFTTLGFHRIELHINVDNKPSIRLAERTGFQFECVRKEFSFEDDQWTDFLIYYKNRSYTHC